MTEKKIICLAVDDEPPALQVIRKYIDAIPSLSLHSVAYNAIDAFSILQEHRIDLLFLDIQMPQLMGTDLIRSLVHPPKVIFTTAYRKFAVDGFELDAVDYLVKPISFDRFLKAVNKVLRFDLTAVEADRPVPMPNAAPPPEEFVHLRAERRNIKIRLSDILFIESLKDYIKVTTTERTIMTKQALSSFQENLPPQAFVRIHRSFIVSVKKVESYSNDLIQIGRFQLPISRSYRHEVENLLQAERRGS
jgi:DNA-binding LytR/AlgR family response regulator